MGEVHLDPDMAAWSSRLDLEQLAGRVEEIRQRLADRQQVLETLQADGERGTAPAAQAAADGTLAELEREVALLKAQFEGVAAVLEWEQARRERERTTNDSE